MKTLALASLLCLTAATHAQTVPAPTTALPSEPAGIAYRYFPRQIVQWVGPELPYSMIELDIDDRGPKPVYDAILTDRATNKRVHYTNEQSEVMVDKFLGVDVYLVPMQLDAPAEAAKGATYLLRFATETGAPVTWQFVLGSDVTEQGSGMTPIPVPSSPALIYREQGGVAGEGTALKVGNITSTADVWKEISQPPYFIAYHGALSQDVHTLAFVPRNNEWKVEPSTAAVAADADWKFTSVDGRVLSAHVDSLKNGLVTLHVTHPILGTSVTVEARQTPAGWVLEQLRYAPMGKAKDHVITLTFSAETAGPSKFDVIAGKKTHLTSGELTTTAAGGESWTLTQPPFTHLPPVVASATQTRASAPAQAMGQSTAPEATAAH